MKKKLSPLLLSACVLPGLGQIQLHKIGKGLCFSLSSILLCLIPLFFFMKSFWRLSTNTMSSYSHNSLLLNMTKNLWQSFLQNEQLILFSFGALTLIWIWNVWDVWKETQISP